jgi:O-antigen/teichoic acid export membrane protein
MSRTHRIVTGFGVTLLNQALVVLVGLWLTRFTLHRVGAHDYGLWLIGAQFVAYLSLLDLGVTALLPRDVARVTGIHAEGDARDAALREVIAESMSIVLWLLVPIGVASAALIVLIPSDWAALRGPLAVSLACFFGTYPLRLAHSTLTGLQDLAYVGGVEIVSWALGVAATVGFIELGFGLYSVAVGPAIAQVVSCVAWIWRLVATHRSALPHRVPWLDPRVVWKRLKPGGWVSLSQIAHLLLNGTDIVIIGRILGPTAVLPYSFTDKSETLFNNQPYTVAALAGPAISQLRGGSDLPRMVRAVRAVSGVVVILSGGIVVAVLATNHAFVRVWIGEDHFGGMFLTMVLLVNMLLGHLSFSFGSTLLYCGYERAIAILSMVNGFLGIGLSILFVRRFGIVGAPIGALLAICLTQVPVYTVLLARELRSSVLELLGGLVPWLTRFAPLVVLAWLVGTRFGARSLPAISLVGGTVVALYAVVMLPLLRKPPLDTYAAPYLAKLEAIRAGVTGWIARDRGPGSL